ncbi:MDR family MFS transporter [Paenibacillus algorifonticola]|uniref:MDR family MFS transporter n=1 Tax=Paenibacillus algorifonticola TaxID=684063 RepID=UPI003D26BE7C
MIKTGNTRSITIALFVATFLAAIEGTIVSTAMPSITRELQGTQQYSWVISIYLLATVVTTPIYGKLSDLFGRKNMFMIGAAIFLCGSMLSGLAQTMTQLIIFRAIQGLGAGALTTIPYTIIGDLYAYEQRAKVQGWMSSIWGIAGISGPLLGGLLVDYVSWRAIFYMNLPFGIVAMFLLGSTLKEAYEKRKRSIDYGGIGTFALGMFCFLYALTLLRSETGEQGASYTEIGLLFAGAAVLMTLFFYIEKRVQEPLIPLVLFKNRTISMVNLLSFLLCIVNVVIIFYLPLWLQGVYGKSATYSGLAMIPLSVSWPLGSILAGTWISRLGLRNITLISAFSLLLGSLGFMFLNATTPIMWFMLYMFLTGLSFGLALTSCTISVSSAVERQMRGASVATNNFIRTLGQTIGIALFGLLLHTGSTNIIDPLLLEESLHQIFTIVVVLSLVIGAVSLALPRISSAERQETKHAS